MFGNLKDIFLRDISCCDFKRSLYRIALCVFVFGLIFHITINNTFADISLTLDKDEVTMEVGETITLEATIEPGDVDVSFVWASKDEDIAIVNYNGEVTAIDEGTTIITVSNSYGVEASCIVNVVESRNYSYYMYVIIAVALLTGFIVFYNNHERD
ncbi:MAG: Ig-like domain-containing protein [Erysipelotrichaceae bacterium]|nr:Ig-like domain-containing protein [Erysipelotrichaceae bacterium]